MLYLCQIIYTISNCNDILNIPVMNKQVKKNLNAGTTYPAIIGSVLKKLREDQNLGQSAIAKEMGITQTTWSKIENGKSALTVAQLARASRILETYPGTIARNADAMAKRLRENGMLVVDEMPRTDNTGLVLLGAAALAGIFIAILAGKK